MYTIEVIVLCISNEKECDSFEVERYFKAISILEKFSNKAETPKEIPKIGNAKIELMIPDMLNSQLNIEMYVLGGSNSLFFELFLIIIVQLVEITKNPTTNATGNSIQKGMLKSGMEKNDSNNLPNNKSIELFLRMIYLNTVLSR